jgi:D-alanyl-D-alanine carboxypeptidase/D-alanyl-D-alanine-endopeptidase (penicillin-binding protein 4)
VRRIAAELDGIFGAPALDRALVAVVVQSLDSGEFLYRRNATKLVMPASNTKIPTVAVAAERLGWEYTYQTRLVTSGTVEGSVLHGDLVVVGTGDPTLNRRNGDPLVVFARWAAKLREAGITEIDGRIIGDDRAFAAERLGAGWSWDYLGQGYAAPVAALQLNEDVVDLVVRPGATPGEPAIVTVRPEDGGILLDNRTVTSSATTPASRARLRVARLPGSNVVRLSGTIPLGTAETTVAASVDDPTDYFVHVLRGVLVRSGIAVSGEALDVRSLSALPDLSTARVLVTHQSAPIKDIAKVLLKVSQNLYVETLLRTVAGLEGDGSAEAGARVVREVLEGWGVPPDSFVLVDGSGLSRYNYLTADTLVSILRRMYRDPRHRDAFMDALPIAGEDGSISRRMRGTRAAGNARAKTGSISNVRALSGYVRTLDGEMLVFSIVFNNFTLPQAAIDAMTDLAVERLANVTRTR